MMNICFILVEPKVPENIGSSARAINTMGFQHLRLVNPCNHLDKRAVCLAYGSSHILENAKLYPSIDKAVNDIDFIIGTTSKKRLNKQDYYSPEQVLELIRKKNGCIRNAAILFGREDKGLLNSELKYCDIVSTVSIKQRYPSLNLAQAVMIYAYSLSPLAIDKKDKCVNNGDMLEMKALKNNVDIIMRKIGFDHDTCIYNRIMERLSALGNTDTHLFHSVCNKLLKHL